MKRYGIILLALFGSFISLSARQTYNFNSGWTIDYSELTNGMKTGTETVTLPHAWNEDQAFKVYISEQWDGIVWYRKRFTLPESAAGQRVVVEFEGCRLAADVVVNGKAVGYSENGVMAFGFDITDYLVDGENLIEVKTDNSWNYREREYNASLQWNSKNFYSNYGGLNKNVWLHVLPKIHQTLPIYSNLGTTGVYVYAKDFDIAARKATICVESEVQNDGTAIVKDALKVIVTDMDGQTVATFEGGESTLTPFSKRSVLKAEQTVSGLHFWSWGYGYLYKVKTVVASDTVTTVTGFRKTEFKDGIFYLNDRAMMVHGYAQRTTNEWPGAGSAVPAWVSDLSNDMFVKSGGNVVRWMHVCPWKQDVESCDRVGLIQAMPAGDAEGDSKGRQWTCRKEVMRDAIIYNRNAPSIIFYECGNHGISREHMQEMQAIRNQYDPNGGRAMGSREMLDIDEAEYGGEMLYINKSKTKPVWMMEYCRDEGARAFWNSWSYPYHQQGYDQLYYNYQANGTEKQFDHISANGQPIQQGEAYLHIPVNRNTQPTLTMVFDDDGSETAIENVERLSVFQSSDNDRYYTIGGQQVDKPTKGLYIYKGKKIVVRN